MSKAILISDLDIQVLVRLLSGVGIAPTPLSEEDAEKAAKSLGARDFVVVRQHSDGSGAAWAKRRSSCETEKPRSEESVASGIEGSHVFDTKLAAAWG